MRPNDIHGSMALVPDVLEDILVVILPARPPRLADPATRGFAASPALALERSKTVENEQEAIR